MGNIPVEHSVAWITPNDHAKCYFLLARTKNSGNKLWPWAAGAPLNSCREATLGDLNHGPGSCPLLAGTPMPTCLPEFWESCIPKSQAAQPKFLSLSVSHWGHCISSRISSRICISFLPISTSSGLQRASNRALSNDSQTVGFHGPIKF